MSDVKYDFDVPIIRAKSPIRDPNSISGVIRGLPKGASIFFPGTKMNIVNNCACVLKRRGHIDFKVACRSVTENDVAGIRVWRLDAE